MIDLLRKNIYRPVYLQNPVNRQHAVNLGLVAWWKCLPGLSGGQYFYDLMALNKGTLTNMGSGSGWGGSPAPGGFGSVQFDGADDFVSSTIAAGLSGSFTMIVWAKITSAGIARMILYSGVVSYGNYWASLQDNGTQWRAALYDGTNNPLVTSTISYALNTWARLAMVRDTASGTLKLYVNGAVGGSTADTTTAPVYSAFQMGYGTPANHFNGQMDSCKIYSRALSASDVVAEYLDERTGCPASLNRFGGPLSAAQQAAAYAAYYRMLQQNIGAAA